MDEFKNEQEVIDWMLGHASAYGLEHEVMEQYRSSRSCQSTEPSLAEAFEMANWALYEWDI